MKTPRRIYAIALITSASLTAAACGGHKDAANGDVATTPAANGGYVAPANTPTSSVPLDTARRAHHSKLGGAVAGAAVGHMLGGHAVLGAAAGALVQHERNKH